MNSLSKFSTATVLAGSMLFVPQFALSDASVIRLSEPVVTTATHEIFGAALEPGSGQLTLSQLVNSEESYLGQEVLIETEISQVCQKKGCFFIARDEDQIARITFKDYGFFIPTDASGKRVTLKGVFSRQALSQEQADHYASDLGEAGGKAPGFEYSIIASAVAIPSG